MSENTHEAATRLMAEHGIRNEDLTKVLDVWREEGCEQAKYEMTHAEFRREREPEPEKPGIPAGDLADGDWFHFLDPDMWDFHGLCTVGSPHPELLLRGEPGKRLFVSGNAGKVYALDPQDRVVKVDKECADE